nr:translocation/assembly module TamB domain-containing protein [Saprospiraceae bacterium]
MKKEDTKEKPSIWRRALKIILLVFGVLLLLSLSLRIPFIQKQITNTVANALTKDLGYEVSVGSVDFNFVNRLTIGDLLIRYETGDTLLYSQRVHATTHKPITSLINRRLEVNKIQLDHNIVNILTKPGIKPLEWKRADRTSPIRFNLSLDAIVMGESSILIENIYSGSREKFKVGELYLTTDLIDLENNRFIFKSLVIDEVDVSLEKFESLVAVTEPEDSEEVVLPAESPKFFKPNIELQLDYMDIRSGSFSSVNYLRKGLSGEGYASTRFNEIDIELLDLYIDSTGIRARPDHLSMIHPDGFELVEVKAESFFFSDKRLLMENMELISGGSFIDETLSLEYEDLSDFSDFLNKVRIGADFRRTGILLSELIFFIPELNRIPFFIENRNRKLFLNGQFSGPINRLQGSDIEMSITDDFYLAGSFSSENLLVPGAEFLNVDIQTLNTSMVGLSDLIPNFKPPKEFYKLDKFNFEGQFTGAFKEFDAKGKLTSHLGIVETDVHMDLTDGIDFARYHGSISVDNFDLKEWTGNPDFDKLNFFAELSEGRGLSLETLHAHLYAEINSFSYKGYQYENLMMDGYLDKKLFDGFFSIEDEFLDFQLVGIVFYGEGDPKANAEIQLNKLNTYELNLTEELFILSGHARINATGINFDFPEGSIALKNWVVEQPDSVFTTLDSMFIVASVDSELNKNLKIQSEVLSADVSGVYYLEQLPDILKDFTFQNYKYGHLLFKDTTVNQYNHADFLFDLEIHDSKGFASILIPEMDTIKNSRVWGEVNSKAGEFKLEFSFPELQYGNYSVEQFYGYSQFDKQMGNTMLNAEKIFIGAVSVVNPTTAFVDFNYDTIGFSLSTLDYSDLVDQIYIEGKSYEFNEKWAFNFSRSNLSLFGEEWLVKEDNEIIFGKQFFSAKNLKLSSEDKSISIESIGDRGISLNLVGLDIDFLNELIDDHRYLLAGNLNLDLWATNIFEFEALNGQLLLNEFHFQEIDYGQLMIESTLQTGTGLLELNMRTTRSDRFMRGSGVVYVDGEKLPADGNILDMDIEIRDFPMLMYEKIIENGVNGTVGTFDGELRILASEWSDISLDGTAIVKNTATNVEILGTRYYIDDQEVKISSHLIDFTGVEFKDELGNTASILGGFRHRNFADMAMDLTISSGRFLAMNTTRDDSNLYYGRLVGQLDADFIGSFQRPDIRVNAINSPGTRLFVLINEFVETGEIDFISFEDEQFTQSRDFFSEVTGVNFLLDITANEDAEVQIIFDEQSGDILRGRGNGAIQVSLTRNGEFNIFGEYEISQGKYLFANTFGLLPINKPFDVLRGGVIQWSGDPLNALIDIQATYSGLNAAPYNFVEDYLQSSGDGQDQNIIAEANQPTPVDLTLLLTGFLVNPEINFSINFPNLTGQLKNLTDRKILELEENQDEMNRQVFALIIIGSFLPSSLNYETSVATIANTFNEWLSNQLSVYLSDLLSEAFDDVGFISGIEMDVGYVLPTGDILNVGSATTNRQGEIRIGLRPSLFDDRVQLNVGGNYVRESFVTSDPYLAPYGTLEYFITPDRRWRLRLSSNLDYVPEGRRNRHSVGVLFRREFDSMEEFMQSIKLFQGSKKTEQPKSESDHIDFDNE